VRRRASSRSVRGGSALGLGISVIWLSLLVLLPLAAVVAKAADYGWDSFWATITNDAVTAALRLTVLEALGVTAVNVVMGTLIAWVLVRDDFPGKAVIELVIDVPFALPTIVAGLVLLSLYGPKSPLGLQFANSRVGIFIALLFVTVPFVVRTVEPVLIELDPESEQAAASLGAGRFTTFRRIVLPNLIPAIAAGAALSFARAISEYGSLVLMSGNLPFRTEVASVKILSLMENDNPGGAAAVATILLLVSVVTLLVIDGLQRLAARRA
jgi:sulfate transport system permease protein